MERTLRMIAWVQWLMMHTPPPHEHPLMQRLARLEDYLIRRYNRDATSEQERG